MTAFIIEHQCPQCGAPAELAESDRFFHCPYCRTSSYLTTAGFFRYVLAHHAPADEKLIYFPYWRFKGMMFSCLTREVKERFVDVSQQAMTASCFPVSLGFRSQTQKLRFCPVEGEDAVFIKPRLGIQTMLADLMARLSTDLAKPILHQEFIGETLSLIYAPYYIKGQEPNVMDAVLNEAVPGGDAGLAESLLSQAEPPRFPISFIPALCPNCGWDLNAQRDALALGCGNCRRVWTTRQGQFSDVHAAHMPGPEQGSVYLPFWRIKADTTPVPLETYADLVKTANLPKVPQPGWEETPFYFWAPAFKVRPQAYLTIATALSLTQPDDKLVSGMPAGQPHAVNLALKEAVESLKLILAGFMRPRERMIEQIPEIQIRARRFKLIFIPFREGHHELIHDEMKLAIHKNVLDHANNL